MQQVLCEARRFDIEVNANKLIYTTMGNSKKNIVVEIQKVMFHWLDFGSISLRRPTTCCILGRFEGRSAVQR